MWTSDSLSLSSNSNLASPHQRAQRRRSQEVTVDSVSSKEEEEEEADPTNKYMAIGATAGFLLTGPIGLLVGATAGVVGGGEKMA